MRMRLARIPTTVATHAVKEYNITARQVFISPCAARVLAPIATSRKVSAWRSLPNSLAAIDDTTPSRMPTAQQEGKLGMDAVATAVGLLLFVVVNTTLGPVFVAGERFADGFVGGEAFDLRDSGKLVVGVDAVELEVFEVGRNIVAVDVDAQLPFFEPFHFGPHVIDPNLDIFVLWRLVVARVEVVMGQFFPRQIARSDDGERVSLAALGTDNQPAAATPRAIELTRRGDPSGRAFTIGNQIVVCLLKKEASLFILHLLVPLRIRFQTLQIPHRSVGCVSTHHESPNRKTITAQRA